MTGATLAGSGPDLAADLHNHVAELQPWHSCGHANDEPRSWRIVSHRRDQCDYGKALPLAMLDLRHGRAIANNQCAMTFNAANRLVQNPAQMFDGSTSTMWRAYWRQLALLEAALDPYLNSV